MRKKLVFLAPLIILAFIGFIAVGGAVVQLLWNWLLPSLFGVRAVTFWQALGILALCRILFGGSGLYSRSRSGVRRRIVDRIRERMAERWEAMTPEERERFQQRMRERCGVDPSTSEAKGQ